uniref:probable ATP-dependent RNA helicase DDX59 n=1 Tax=Myxine glutinosa TaxID=7769 RepID=UPI00358E209B
MFVPRVVKVGRTEKRRNVHLACSRDKARPGVRKADPVGNVQLRENSEDGEILRGERLSGDGEQNEEKLEGSEGKEDVQEKAGPEEPIISYSKQQRWPDPGEPECVVCGRYGEYVCATTERDVCSLECKAYNLRESSYSLKPPNAPGVLEDQPDTCRTLDVEDELEGFQYQEHPFVKSLSEERVTELRQALGISVHGDDVPRPVLAFAHCSLQSGLVQNLTEAGLGDPTPVQMQIIPAVLAGRDVLVQAETGSGKTDGFLVPIIARLHAQRWQGRPHAIVLTPTRELSIQLEQRARRLIAGLPDARTALLVGGLPLPNQRHRLKQRIKLVLGTPGRVLELVKEGTLLLESISSVLVDEVDTMLELGFREQVQSVLDKIPNNRQTLLASATLPDSTRDLAVGLLRHPVWVTVATENYRDGDDKLATGGVAAGIKQILLWVEEPAKKKKLFDVLADARLFVPPVLVFVESKTGAELLAQAVATVTKLRAIAAHGDRGQEERATLLQGITEGDYDVVVSTGLLGRGLDLVKVRLVVNFDLPSSMDQYIHQVGRVGRLGSHGTALTFMNNRDRRLFLELTERLAGISNQLPAQLLNSPHLLEQRRRRQWKESQRLVTPGNLREFLQDAAREGYARRVGGPRSKRARCGKSDTE